MAIVAEKFSDNVLLLGNCKGLIFTLTKRRDSVDDGECSAEVQLNVFKKLF